MMMMMKLLTLLGCSQARAHPRLLFLHFDLLLLLSFLATVGRLLARHTAAVFSRHWFLLLLLLWWQVLL